MKKITLVILGSIVLAGTAQAQVLGETPTAPSGNAGVVSGVPAQGFGTPGQVAIADDFFIAFSYVTDTEASAIGFRPAVDVFIAPNLSLGGQFVLDYSKQGSAHTTTVGIGPRVGFNVPLADFFSLYPRLGLSYNNVSGTGFSSYNLLTLIVYAPFLFVPATNFFIGIGPTINADIAGADSNIRTFRFGLLSTVGGYFDW
jgi:hypothetical protein